MITYTLEINHPRGEPDLWLPVVVCDACGRQVIGNGNVYWLVRYDNGEALPGLWHAHKSCCRYDRYLEGTHPNTMCMFEELDVWLRQLAHNAAAGRTE